jgi:hypothetical protein
LVGAKIIVNENHFWFDGKSFSEIKLFALDSLHTLLISDCRNPAMVRRGIQAAPESGNIRPPEYGDILSPSPDACGPDSGHGQKLAGIQPDLTGSCH